MHIFIVIHRVARVVKVMPNRDAAATALGTHALKRCKLLIYKKNP